MNQCDKTTPAQPQNIVAAASSDTVQEILNMLADKQLPPETALANLAVAMSHIMGVSGCHQFFLSNPLSNLIVMLQTSGPENGRMVH
ncbi:hypothetical protein FJU30_03940 [Affinibrenneria salicis]|uniref:Uncharacterized protein n=1 Tax=Affinibrenneria salicis TaxID=2590031 RepID=A0A5J5G5U0_9GAMM|nr:hypothetical protein [Affinibrenneria salicis]KAA9002576.1 hypothetical protein FJU30_00825 [Affinibrenneria salicis]KAA9003136.1 hypothetical protein FJU30_03940 [Affinibrenneria salicis]